ncbi:cupin-like domain-containing protein [Hymenobacter actinosclerus]|uniref:Cupin-like domain-containing protein n=1 Tax=Hymenobacter actinosclerus TaxID=82805 RepID=A0A1I0IK02_9BACT|nr:cupin-like domain-containing protein [Hymenobacter actinosclerus]SET96697.1 Cupin-like domain-containing protein [Hymenobacter actinosclerus]
MQKIQIVDTISGPDFHERFVKTNTPVLIRNMAQQWRALHAWNEAEYFEGIENGVKLATKVGDVSKGQREMVLLSNYVRQLQDYEACIARGEEARRPAYLHDVPIFNLIPGLIKDIMPFPTELLPEWYHEQWYNYIQFFMGATGSLTPLHFDTLCTHNLFFQVAGRKRFLLIPPNQKEKCYVEGWRWARFDPNQPDYEKFPLAQGVNVMEVELDAGDILFMPSGTLHQVHGLSYSVSFNIDWHTTKSARKGVMSVFRGAPRQNGYYNMLILAGLSLKVPPRYIFPRYKSYLNYVS